VENPYEYMYKSPIMRHISLNYFRLKSFTPCTNNIVIINGPRHDVCFMGYFFFLGGGRRGKLRSLYAYTQLLKYENICVSFATNYNITYTVPENFRTGRGGTISETRLTGNFEKFTESCILIHRNRIDYII